MRYRINDFDRMFFAMDQLQDKVNRMFYGNERTFAPRSDWGNVSNGPDTNLYDTGEHFAMQIEMPGIERGDINIKLQGKYLEVSGKREKKSPEGYSALRSERSNISFSRSFTLSDEIDSSKVEAKLENGILTLVLPKAEAAQPRQITIN